MLLLGTEDGLTWSDTLTVLEFRLIVFTISKSHFEIVKSGYVLHFNQDSSSVQSSQETSFPYLVSIDISPP